MNFLIRHNIGHHFAVNTNSSRCIIAGRFNCKYDDFRHYYRLKSLILSLLIIILKKFFKYTFRTVLVIILLVVILFVTAFFLIQQPKVQTYMVHKVSEYLSKQLGSEVKVDSVSIKFIRTMEIHN